MLKTGINRSKYLVLHINQVIIHKYIQVKQKIMSNHAH